MKKPWQQHSSTWDVPWDKRPEQNFDTDKVVLYKNKSGSLVLTLTALIAMVCIPVIVGLSLNWAVHNPRFNENPHFNHCELVQDGNHPTGSYYRCHE